MQSRRKRATREAIMDSALQLFAERGYDRVRVEDIAQEAGVSRATFYNHFAEREEILGALIEQLLNTEEGLAPALMDGASPLQRIEEIVVDTVGRMLGQPELARVLYSLPVRHEALLKPHSSTTPATFRTIHHLLEEAAAQGEVRDDTAIDIMCVHVHNALEAGMRAWAEGRADDPTERVRTLVRLALYGVVAQPSSRELPRVRRPQGVGA